MAVSLYTAGSRLIKHILLTLAMLVVADGLISQHLTRYGLGREGNPFLRTLVSDGNFLLIKVAGALLGVLILWDIYRRQPRLGLISSLLFLALYSGILWWNLAIFFVAQA